MMFTFYLRNNQNYSRIITKYTYPSLASTIDHLYKFKLLISRTHNISTLDHQSNILHPNALYYHNYIAVQSGPEVIKLFSCSTQLSMKFSLLINMKMPTIFGIFIFINRENFMLSCISQDRICNC